MKKIEILAPAGSFESLQGAIRGGCDAVYLGGNKFGARAFAQNFDEETMKRAIDYTHMFDKKIYLTVNTLLRNDEIEELYDYLLPYVQEGLDAVIVQDMGVMSFIHANFPALDIHGSTQMTFSTAQGPNALKEMGLTRFVTARESSIAEIKKMRQNTDLEIETFVHGALCYSYSGQCFMSSMIGGRSGNRGRCAQPCRMPYEITDAAGNKVSAPPYVCSPKDMCTLDCIPDLVEAGIDSFKIEGRMKKPAYAAYTAHLYRKYVDIYLEHGKGYAAYLEKHKKELQYDYTCLMDLYNRGGFSKGYFYEKNGPQTMSMQRPNHSGVYVGKVSQMQKNRATIELVEDLYAQDILEFRGKDGRALYEYTVKNDVGKKEQQTQTNTKPGSKIQVGDAVYRTRRNALLNEISANILEKELKLPVHFSLTAKVGQALQLTAYTEGASVTVTGAIVDVAKSQPITVERFQKQLNKLQDTCFTLVTCEVETEGPVFTPMGKINQLRREAIAALEEKLVGQLKRVIHTKGNLTLHEKCDSITTEKQTKVSMVVTLRTMDQVLGLKKTSHLEAVYLDMAAFQDEELLQAMDQITIPVYLYLPAILRGAVYEKYAQAMEMAYAGVDGEEQVLARVFQHTQVKGFVIRNFEESSLCLKYVVPLHKFDVVLDYNMYTFNQYAKDYWKEKGIAHSTVSVELNGSQIGNLGCADQDLLVYGKPALMTSTQCVQKNVRGCKQQPGMLVLEDKFHKQFAWVNYCKYCYNQMYAHEPLSLHAYITEILDLNPRRLRLDFTVEKQAHMLEIIAFYQESIEGKNTECPIFAFETGHYRRGVQ